MEHAVNGWRISYFHLIDTATQPYEGLETGAVVSKRVPTSEEYPPPPRWVYLCLWSQSDGVLAL